MITQRELEIMWEEAREEVDELWEEVLREYLEDRQDIGEETGDTPPRSGTIQT